MAEKREDIRDKLERVLNEMLVRDGQVLDTVYMEMMITHLSGKNGEDYAYILKSSFLQDWVKRSFAQVNPNGENLQLYAFTLRLLALLMQNEWQFLTIMDTDICTNMNQYIETNPAMRTAQIKLAHVHVLSAMLCHSVGAKWIINSKSWSYVLSYCLENQTIYVLRDALLFMDKFTHLVGADLNDEPLCTEILAAITAPLERAIVVHNQTIRVDSSDLQRNVMPCLKILTSLMDHCIRNEKKSCIPHILCKVTKCKMNLWRLTDMTKDENFFKHIIGSLVMLNFLEYVDQLDNTTGVSFNQNQFGLHFFNHMKFCLVHGNAMALLCIAKMYHMLWTSLGARLPEEIELEGNRIKFENQIITLQLTPIIFSIVKQREDSSESEMFDSYIMKLFDISTDHTLRVCYAFRELLIKNRNIVSGIACKSIQGIMSMKNLHRDRAVYVFQALSYSLREIAFEDQPRQAGVSSDRLIEMPHFLSAILSGLHELVQVYKITWKESIESMCLLNFMLILLNNPTLPPRLSVQALKLTQLALEHFLAPNLALLVENLKGSALENLGATVLKRLHDSSWEVRDSALEVITSMATISVVKFPAFQQHIIDSRLCEEVVQIAKNEAEAFVRASAINCLCPMVNVKLLWEQSLCNYDLMNFLLTTIHTESEGIVRKEYCLLIGELYRNHKIPNADYELIFPTMAHVAINDLYWETKLNALYFWKQVILRQFKYNGVIDGSFPSVTFSKQHKKIVTLNPKEITSRLDLIMDELTTRGALGVLIECLNDVNDLEVVKMATKIAQRMHVFFDKYNYKKEDPSTARKSTVLPSTSTNFSEMTLGDDVRIQSASVETSSAPSVHPMSEAQSDAVIQTIVALDDINLLGHAISLGDQTSSGGGSAGGGPSSATTTFDQTFFRRIRQVGPDEYLKQIALLDLSTLVEKRNAWIQRNESFDSLLDDLMFSLQIGDANNADCY